MPTTPTYRITVTLSKPELRALRSVLDHVVDHDGHLAEALGSSHHARLAAARSMRKKMNDADEGAIQKHLYPRRRDGALRQDEAPDLLSKVSALIGHATALATRVYERNDENEVRLASKMLTSALSLKLVLEQIQKRLAE